MKYFVAFAFMILVVGCNSEILQIEKKSLPFNIRTLTELDPFDGQVFEENSRWLIVAYVPMLSCQTCTNRDLKYLSEMSKRYSKKLDFALVCNKGNFEYIRNIRRVTKISFPIYIETVEGVLGLVPHFNIQLVDKAGEKSILQLYPTPDIPVEKGMVVFEEEVLKIIGYQ